LLASALLLTIESASDARVVEIDVCAMTPAEADLIYQAIKEEKDARYDLSTLDCAAKSLEARGRVDDAERVLRSGVESEGASSGDPSGVLLALGRFHSRTGRVDSAIEIWQKLVPPTPPKPTRVGAVDLYAPYMMDLAEREFAAGRVETAHRLVALVKNYYSREFSSKYDDFWLPQLFLRAGEPEEAWAMHEARVEAARASGDDSVLALELRLFAESLRSSGRREDALEKEREAEVLESRAGGAP
jgi:tetratricopeptide (TPR) repeat protein